MKIVNGIWEYAMEWERRFDAGEVSLTECLGAVAIGAAGCAVWTVACDWLRVLFG